MSQEYKLKVLGKEGEEYNYPVGLTTNIEIVLDNVRALKESEYWEIQIYSIDNTLVFKEDMKLGMLLKYEEYFGNGREIDTNHIATFKGDTLDQFIGHVGGLEKGLTLDRDGLKLVLTGDRDKYGVVGIKPSETLWEDYDGLESRGVVAPQGGTPAGLSEEELRAKTFIYYDSGRGGSLQPLHLEVEYLEGFELLELRGEDWYDARLEYCVKGKSYILGVLRVKANNIGGISILNQGLTRREQMFTSNLDAVRLVESIDDNLKSMLLEEAIA